MITKEALESAIVDNGESVYQMSLEKPILLVFLRHFGCIYCREALIDLKDLSTSIKEKNVIPILVHMSDTETANKYLLDYGLEGVHQISDPKCALYSKFGLVQGKMGQLFGLKVWTRGFEQMAKRNPFSLNKVGDALQMPGVFFVSKGKVTSMFVHHSIADKPDYLSIINDGLA